MFWKGGCEIDEEIAIASVYVLEKYMSQGCGEKWINLTRKWYNIGIIARIEEKNHTIYVERQVASLVWEKKKWKKKSEKIIFFFCRVRARFVYLLLDDAKKEYGNKKVARRLSVAPSGKGIWRHLKINTHFANRQIWKVCAIDYDFHIGSPWANLQNNPRHL